jgi:hypothetical protein
LKVKDGWVAYLSDMENNMKKFLAGLTLLLGLSVQAHAATITSLNDSFEADGSGNNFNSFSNWVVTDGTVDLYEAPGGHGFTCSDGLFCVDLDGSTKNAGVLTTKDGFAAGQYEVSFDLSGNQRAQEGYGSDVINVQFGAGSLVSNLVLSADADWSTYTFLVDLAEGDKLSFANLGGDNAGMMLDNVSVSAVPVPAAAFLFAPALLGFMGLRRKAAKA